VSARGGADVTIADHDDVHGTDDTAGAAEEALEEGHFKPTGTIVFMGIFVAIIILLWASVYVILLSRGVTV
jgi:hypothetical protein